MKTDDMLNSTQREYMNILKRPLITENSIAVHTPGFCNDACPGPTNPLMLSTTKSV